MTEAIFLVSGFLSSFPLTFVPIKDLPYSHACQHLQSSDTISPKSLATCRSSVRSPGLNQLSVVTRRQPLTDTQPEDWHSHCGQGLITDLTAIEFRAEGNNNLVGLLWVFNDSRNGKRAIYCRPGLGSSIWRSILSSTRNQASSEQDGAKEEG